MTFGGPALMARTSTFALSPLRAALLGLLATEPDDGLSTAHVIDLLWKPGPSSRLRHRISQLIYALNRELPEKVVVRHRHRLYLSRTVVTDYQQFEAAMLNGRLMEAEALLSRGFLSQLAEPPSEAFLEWLDRTTLKLRDRVRRDAAGAWTRLMDRSRWTQAVEAARVLLALNVYDEGALRMLMRAEAMAGRVGEAKAVFDSFVERSESDKRDWVPQAETLSLVDEIRDLPFGVSTKFAAQALDRSPLIGRSDELDELSTAMLPRPGDGLRLVVIRGERGTGKTRLLEESLATDLLNGIPVLRYPTSKTERRAFLNSVLGTLASSNADSDLSGLTAPWHATMLDLLAEPHAGTALPFEPPAVEPDQGHQRYVDIIRQALVAVAGNEPIIFVIDDCHRVDEEFAEVLLYLVQRWPSPRLAVTLAIGTEGVREKDPFIRLLGDSLLECEVAEFTLDELTRDAAAELVDTVAEGRIEEGERDRIVELSDQNPLFLLKLSKLSLAGSRLPNLDPDDFVSVPQSISDVFSGRLAELDDDTERTLQLLSVMGRPLGVGTLSKLSDRSRDSCVDALDILQQSRLVRRAASGFAVRYELIRHAVYDRMSVPRRTWVHGRVASHLDDANTSQLPPNWRFTTFMPGFRSRLCGTCWPEPVPPRSPVPSRRRRGSSRSPGDTLTIPGPTPGWLNALLAFTTCAGTSRTARSGWPRQRMSFARSIATRARLSRKSSASISSQAAAPVLRRRPWPSSANSDTPPSWRSTGRRPPGPSTWSSTSTGGKERALRRTRWPRTRASCWIRSNQSRAVPFMPALRSIIKATSARVSATRAKRSPSLAGTARRMNSCGLWHASSRFRAQGGS